jgi:hypothetical protein
MFIVRQLSLALNDMNLSEDVHMFIEDLLVHEIDVLEPFKHATSRMP